MKYNKTFKQTSSKQSSSKKNTPFTRQLWNCAAVIFLLSVKCCPPINKSLMLQDSNLATKHGTYLWYYGWICNIKVTLTRLCKTK